LDWELNFLSVVASVEDAYRCFLRTEMDYLCIENFVMAKKSQKKWERSDEWQQEFQLD